MITSIGVEKAFDKIYQQFMIKILSKLSIQSDFFNFIKSIYRIPTVGIILTGEKLEDQEQGSMTPHTIVFNIAQEDLVNQKENKGNKNYTYLE